MIATTCLHQQISASSIAIPESLQYPRYYLEIIRSLSRLRPGILVKGVTTRYPEACNTFIVTINEAYL